MIFVMRHWDGFEFQVMPDGIFLVWEDMMCLFGDSFPFVASVWFWYPLVEGKFQ